VIWISVAVVCAAVGLGYWTGQTVALNHIGAWLRETERTARAKARGTVPDGASMVELPGIQFVIRSYFTRYG
jgi:hypothetical protein